LGPRQIIRGRVPAVAKFGVDVRIPDDPQVVAQSVGLSMSSKRSARVGNQAQIPKYDPKSKKPNLI